MKKMMLASLVVFTVLFLGSCKSAGSDPKATLIAFFDALEKKDIEGARKLATAESKSMIDMMEMGMKMAKDSKDADKFDKTKMEFGEAKIEGDKASVPVKEKSTGETTNFTLKKEGGSWKVAFDKNSMMEMGMQKMKDHGENTDKMKNEIDQLKNLNADSIKDAMEKSAKTLDSVDKLLKDIKSK
jgi:hypothetical protein